MTYRNEQDCKQVHDEGCTSDTLQIDASEAQADTSRTETGSLTHDDDRIESL